MSTTHTAYDEILTFITSGPSVDQIANYKHSDTTLKRVSQLKQLATDNQLTPHEAYELREFRRAEYFLDMLRIRALRRMQAN